MTRRRSPGEESPAVGRFVAELIRSALNAVGGEDIEWRMGSASGDFDNATVTGEVHLEPGVWFGEVSLVFDSIHFAPLADEAIRALTGVAVGSWKVSPDARSLRISARVPVQQLRRAQDDPESLLVPDDIRRTHIARRAELGEALVDGRVLRGLCGDAFVPTENEKQDEQPCRLCLLIHRVTERLGEFSPEQLGG